MYRAGEDDVVKVTVREGVSVTAVRVQPKGDAGWTFVYAPGAGSNVNDPFGKHLCDALAARGVMAVRFQFPYQEAGRSGPDRPDVLEATWRAVIDAVREDGAKLAIGGRSMGGRVASMVHAGGVKADALVLFAYPLHPPGRPDKMRDEHLPSIKSAHALRLRHERRLRRPRRAPRRRIEGQARDRASARSRRPRLQREEVLGPHQSRRLRGRDERNDQVAEGVSRAYQIVICRECLYSAEILVLRHQLPAMLDRRRVNEPIDRIPRERRGERCRCLSDGGA